MKKIIALVVLLCALTISSTASAADYKYICTSAEGNDYFIDYSSISQRKGEKGKDGLQFSVIIKIIYSEFGRAKRSNSLPPELINFAVYELDQILFRVKKSQKGYRLERGAIYAYDGTILSNGHHFNSFVKIANNSVFRTLFDAAYNRL